MRRRDLLAGSLVVLMAGCACSRRKSAAGPQKLRVGAPRRLSASGLHLADELGYFQEAGLELEILESGGQANAWALLAGGKLDVYVSTLSTSFLNAVLKGLPLRIVAAWEIAEAGCGNVGAIYGLRRTFPHGLADAAPLKGKRVATGPMIGLAQFALDAHLSRAGLSRKDVTTVSLDFSQNVAALLGGSVDAIMGTDDFARDLASLSAEMVHTPGLAWLYPNFQYTFIFFGRTLMEADPNTGARFLSACLRGAREFARGRTPRFTEEYARANRLDAKRFLATCRNALAPDGAIDLNSLRLFADWAARNKFIPRRVEASEIVDDRFLKRIHAR